MVQRSSLNPVRRQKLWIWHLKYSNIEDKTHITERRTGAAEVRSIREPEMPSIAEQQVRVPAPFLRSAGYAPPGTARPGFDKLRRENIGMPNWVQFQGPG